MEKGSDDVYVCARFFQSNEWFMFYKKVCTESEAFRKSLQHCNT